MIFAGDFEDGREGVSEYVHAVTNALSDLKIRVSIKRARVESCPSIALTCWLIRTTAMSFRSWVKLWKARSISDVSVLESTTRKLRWASGGSVTCWRDAKGISFWL